MSTMTKGPGNLSTQEPGTIRQQKKRQPYRKAAVAIFLRKKPGRSPKQKTHRGAEKGRTRSNRASEVFIRGAGKGSGGGGKGHDPRQENRADVDEVEKSIPGS